MSVADVYDRAQALTAPLDRRTHSEWAADGNVIIPANSPYARTGSFTCADTRHWIAPLDALADDSVRDVVIMAPPRTGKNVVADVWACSIVRRTPGPMQWLASTDKITEDYKSARLDRLFEASPAVKPFLPADPKKNTRRKIDFLHGMPFWIEGPATANLQTKGIRFQVRDELWLWDSKLKEADARLGDFDEFEAGKSLTISQGGWEDTPFDHLAKECVWHEQFVECQECGEFFVPVITGYREGDHSRYGFIWADDCRDEMGNLSMRKVMESLRYEPPCCGKPHIETAALKAAWNLTTRYEVTNEDGNPRKKLFHLYATALKRWEIIIGNLVSAHNARRLGDHSLLEKFTQKEEARNFSERALAANRQTAIQIETPDDPEGAVRIATVDVQSEWFWYSARVWEPGAKSRRLKFAKLYTEAEIHETNHALGIEPCKCLVDSGYRAKGDTGVYSMCIQYGWIPTKGVDQESFAHKVQDGRGRVVGSIQKSYAPPVLVDSERGRAEEGDQARMIYLVRYSAPSMYSKLDGLINTRKWQEPEPDATNPLEREYERQMRSTVLVQERGKWIWKTIDNENHAWDLAGMQILGAVLCDILPDAYGEEGEKEQ